MTVCSTENRKGIGLIAGALTGACAGVWLWWALQLGWWAGIVITAVAGGLFCGWLRLQLNPLGPRKRHLFTFVALSWVCLIGPVVTTAVFFHVMPASVEPSPEAKEAASHLAMEFIPPQALFLICGMVSLWGLRSWKPIGVLIRSAIGVTVSCVTAYHFLMRAIFVNIWH